MQLTAQPANAQDSAGSGASNPAAIDESDYVGKHRPHRLSLRHPRDRAGKLAKRVERESTSSAQ